MTTGLRILLAPFARARSFRADKRGCAVIEPLEPRRLLDGAAVLGISPAIDPAPSGDLVQAAPAIALEPADATSNYSLDQTFLLHSNPGASKVIYLDFDGHVTSDTTWNTVYAGGADIVTPAFSLDGESAFSDTELTRIQYIWQRVAEDFLPFNVDVTTEDPGIEALRKFGTGDSAYGVRVCIGGDSDWYGPAVGGVSYIGSFDYNNDTPCYAFPENLGGGNEKYTAEATTHEIGHTLDLHHDGTSTAEYYEGHGAGATGWAPIMGVGYYKQLTQWSKGEYADADNQAEDDLYMIAEDPDGSGTLGYRADDHGGQATAASALAIDGSSVSGEGIIEQNTDVDYFVFVTGAGTVSLSISPDSRGPNLDILATLYDYLGGVVATSNPASLLDASFSLSLPAGTYYLSVDGTGMGDPLGTGYTDYGSLGYYSISGTLVPVSLPEVTIEAADPAAGEEGPDTATFRVWRTGDTGSPLEVFYSVSGWAVEGTDYEPLAGSVTIEAGSSWADVVVTPIDDSVHEYAESVVLTLDPSADYHVGAAASAEAVIADDDPPAGTDSYAISESTTYGTVLGTGLANTLASDNDCERIKEMAINGISKLEHAWTFDLPAAPGGVTFYVEAHHTYNTEGDDFSFAWSADGQTWNELLTVTITDDANIAQSASLPDGLAGTVYIRVTDTDRTYDNRVGDSIFVDHLFIRTAPGIAGDANLDGEVNGTDYLTVKRSLGAAGGATWYDGDFDADGDVDYADMEALRVNMGTTYDPTPAAARAAEAPALIDAAPNATDLASAAVEAPMDALGQATPVGSGAPSSESALQRLAAMAAAAHRARANVFALARNQLPLPAFAARRSGVLLPWWLRRKDKEDETSADFTGPLRPL